MAWLALVILVGAPRPVLGATRVQRCDAGKTKAVGVAMKALTRCQAKARQKDATPSATCITKAHAKLRKQFSTAEKRETCPRDAETAIVAATGCVASLDQALAGYPSCVARKLAAAGKDASGRSACEKKSILAGTTVDPSCLAKVARRVAKAIAKADRKGICTGTTDEVEALVDVCLADAATRIPCSGGAGFATCDGTCPEGLACRPFETFEHGASVETGCSCVDVLEGPVCAGTTCGTDRHCDDPDFVCERWLAGDPPTCDHMICQPAITTPTTLPPDDKITDCDGGEFPTCGGTCPNGQRCQAAQGILLGYTLFAGCICVDPRDPRCEMPADCELSILPHSHCADPSKVCLINLTGSGDDPVCQEAHCGDPEPIVPPPTTVTSTSSSIPTTTSSTTTTSTSTSTTTSTSLPCVSTPATSGCFSDPGDCTIVDGCTGLQWEQKSAAPGRHQVDSRHPWAGRCDGNPMFLCQPDAAAAATCAAHAEGGTYGCAECATGVCIVEVDGVPTTTAWEWINQLNAESFAGHTDWRLPREAGLTPTGDRELESILITPYPCATSPCIDPIFGPTAPNTYWSATTTPANQDDAWFVYFGDGGWGNDGKRNTNRVRAVR